MAVTLSKKVNKKLYVEFEDHFEDHMEYDPTNPPLSVIVEPVSPTPFMLVEPTKQFCAAALNIWTRSAVGKTNAENLISNIQNSTPQQCESAAFWESNVVCGQHLSWEQWQPILNAVASAIRRENVDQDAYMLFSKVFLDKIQCTNEQRQELFAYIQPSQNAFLNKNSFMNKILEKQYTLLKKMNHNSVRQEMKRTFKG